MVEVIRSGVLVGVRHGFLGRRGGVSTGTVAGLNVGLGAIGPGGDSPEAVAENRARAVAALYDGVVPPEARLATVFQVHSPDCVVVQATFAEEERPRADAMVTRTPGVVLGILTADCAPVLFADREAGVIGAAHAAMEQLGARRERVAAVIGPCIAQASYEVDEVFFARFMAAAPGNADFFLRGRVGHWQFDLEGFVAARLRQTGIGVVESLGLDTYSAPDRFFSYRRATHMGEAAYGRQIALVAL